jgi:hypothetical protein
VSGVQRFPRGSEWRKWDLHLHPPGTLLNDGYKNPGGDVWQRFCQTLEDSEVAAFAITDYFSLDGFFATKEHFEQEFPESGKVLFPNLELRLNETVNGERQEVHIHVMLRPELDRETADRLLGKLDTEVEEPVSRRPLSCKDLGSTENRQRATVTRAKLKEALEDAFGKGKPVQENALVVVAANNSGIRAEDGKKRKANLADSIDRLADAVFGNASNTAHYLRTDRTRDNSVLAAKPVFGGSDAHSFKQLDDYGVEPSGEEPSHVTWIKSDPTYEGLLQTLVEPEERVHLGAVRPDRKEPYKVISELHFSGTDKFPENIMLNQNLVSVIGSRSSGKSALLAYIAHAVDPGYCEHQQCDADRAMNEKTVGPAPGIAWKQVSEIECEVVWGDEGSGRGKVIYIPQNSLFSISENAQEITAKIKPTLEVQGANEEIRDAAEVWFREATSLDVARADFRDLGEQAEIKKAKQQLEEKIENLRKRSSLEETASGEYEELVERLDAMEARKREIDAEISQLAPHLRGSEGAWEPAASVGATLRLSPAPAELPEATRPELEQAIETGEQAAQETLAKVLVGRQLALESERASLVATEATLRGDNQDLIKQNQADEEVEAFLVDRRRQDEVLGEIASKAEEIRAFQSALAAAAARIETAVADRDAAIEKLKELFKSQPRLLEGEMGFGIERGLNSELQAGLTERINRKHSTDFVDRESGVKLDSCQADPEGFLAAIHGEEQKVIQGQDPQEVGIDVLLASPEVRFSAEIEEDKIGGFAISTMTPGKQALFALTLILNESEEAWPLLIDQPEDDLDSRSIYEVLVKYLCERKAERQIIMVSHDANLVIGADSEQVIVANRHGDEGRENKDGRLFDYFSGSLEHSRQRKDSPIAFELGGIREHACEILDGGEEAFRKRQEKYKIT